MAELSGADAAEITIASTWEPDAVAVITVAGDLDMSNAGRLDRAIGTVATEQPRRLVLDLRGLRFMDSAGIAVLLGALGRVSELRLREPSPAVRRVLELTGLHELLSAEEH